MSRYSWLAAAAAIAFAAAACASDGGDMAADTMSSSADAMAPSAAAPPPMHDDSTPASGTFTDDQLRSFAAASAEINPIASTLSTATPEQRTAGADQIRAVLQRNNLDVDTYNAIASHAQSDPAFAERIRALVN